MGQVTSSFHAIGGINIHLPLVHRVASVSGFDPEDEGACRLLVLEKMLCSTGDDRSCGNWGFFQNLEIVV